MTTAQDAHAQLSAARAAALAWLRATLASLPPAVTSLSVGAVLEDADDRPTLAPRLRAEVVTSEVTLRYPEDYPDDALECLDALDDGLVDMTRTFLFAMSDEEWLTVTRADLAVVPAVDVAMPLAMDATAHRWVTSKNTPPGVGLYGVQPIPAADGPVLAAIMQEITDLPRGEATTILCCRNTDGTLTWSVTAP